jgi:hypothetical protein
MRTASIYSGPGYYELRGNYGSQVCFVELAPSRRRPDGRGWFKVSATAEDQEGEGTMLAPQDTLVKLLIRKVEDGPAA